MDLLLSYVNKSQKTVQVSVSWHARMRFMERCNRALHTDLDIGSSDAAMEDYFTKSTRLVKLDQHYRTRLKTHGEDTIYFISYPFIFVVQNSVLVTIELHGYYRPLNKPPHDPTPAAPTLLPVEFPKTIRLKARVQREWGRVTTLNLGSYRPEASDIRDPSEIMPIERFARKVLCAKKPGYVLLSVSIDSKDYSEDDVLIDLEGEYTASNSAA